MSDKVANDQSTPKASSAKQQSSLAESQPQEQPKLAPDLEFMRQADAELAQTPSSWKEIDSIVAYDAGQSSGQTGTITQPSKLKRNHIPATQSQAAPPIQTEDMTGAAVGAVSGATMTGRVSNAVKILLRAAGLAVLAGVAWYAYVTYIAS